MASQPTWTLARFHRAATANADRRGRYRHNVDRSARQAGYVVAVLVAIFSTLYLPGPRDRDLPPRCDISDYNGPECAPGLNDWLQFLISPQVLGIGLA